MLWRCRSSSPGGIEDPDSREEASSKDSDKAKNTRDRLVGAASQLDLDSGEAASGTVGDAEPSPRKLVDISSVKQLNLRASASADRRRTTTPVEGAGSAGVLSAGRSRELPGWDSVEDDAGRPAAVRDRRRDTDHDGESLLARTPSASSDELSVKLKLLTVDFDLPLRNQRTLQL